MKSKMKTTFALIAVALMVMVAVVPMVGAFTEAAAPAVVVDPELSDGPITISGTIYSKPGTGVEVGYASVSFGAYEKIVPVGTGNDAGKYSVTFQEIAISGSVTVKYLDKDKNEVEDYGKATLTGLKSGSYTADLQAGHNTAVVKVIFSSGEDLIEGMTVSGKVKVEKIITPATETTPAVTEEIGVFTFNKDGTVQIYYPLSDNAEAFGAYTYTFASGFTFYMNGSQTSAVTVPTTAVTATQNAIKVNENLYKVSPASLGSAVEFTISEVKPVLSEGTPVAFGLLTSKIQDKAVDTVAYITHKEVYESGTKVTVKIKDPNSTSNIITIADDNFKIGQYSTISPTFEYADKFVFYGIVAMEVAMEVAIDVKFKMAGTLTFKNGQSTVASSIPVDADGNYFVNTNVAVTAAEPVVKTGTFKVSQSQEFTKFKLNGSDIPSEQGVEVAGEVNISLDKSDYSLVTGTLYLKVVDDNNIIKDKKMSVTGGKTFGSLTTDGDGMFKFMAETGKELTIKGDDSKAQYTGDINVIPGPASTGKAICMSTQKVTVKAQDALGINIAPVADADGSKVAALAITLVTLKIDGTVDKTVQMADAFTYVAASKTYEGTIRADLTPTDYKVNVVDTANDPKYHFEKVNYASSVVCKANEADYKITVKDASGAKINDENSPFAINIANVYKNTTGAIVYESGTVVSPTYASGVMSFTIESKYVGFSDKDVTTAPKKMLIAFLDTEYAGGLFFNKAYFVATNAKGEMTITAGEDSIKDAKLTKLDGTTAIAGATVEIGTLVNETFTPSQFDIAYTDAKGQFTINYDKKIDGNVYVRFTIGTHVVPAKVAYKDNAKVTAYTTDKDGYTISFVDADDAEITIADNDKITFKNGSKPAEDRNANDLYAWKVGDKVTATLKTSTDAIKRTFASHTITATEVASGDITFVSEQKTYAFYTVDSDLEPIAGAVISVKALFDDSAYGNVPATVAAKIPAIGNVQTDVEGKATALLTEVTNADLNSAKITGYGIVATGTGFSTTPTKVNAYGTIVVSTSETYKIAILDAAGEPISISQDTYSVGNMTVYEDGVALQETVAYQNGYFTVHGDSTKTYTYTIPNVKKNNVSYYNFPEKATPDEFGVIYAYQEWVIGDVTDAVGNAIEVLKGTATIGATYFADAKACEVPDATYDANGYFYTILVDKDQVKYYTVTCAAAANLGYTFDKSISEYIAANEQTVLFGAVSATGVSLNAVFADAKAYDENGKKIGTQYDVGQVCKGIIVDVDEVVGYTATVTLANYFPAGTYTSLDGVFVSSITEIQGTVPNGTEKLILSYYLEGELVKAVNTPIENGEYTAYIDMSDYVVSGVAFDSIVAECYDANGALIAAEEVDPTSPYNPVIVPAAPNPIPGGSEVMDGHYSAIVVGNLIVLSADQSFDKVIPTTQVEGKQLVERYTFAGWYVDGVKVSDATNYSMIATGDVAVTPDYKVEIVEVVAPQPEPTPEPAPADNSIDPTVLVIGICAVIVALIAVAYAVIASRPKEKKE